MLSISNRPENMKTMSALLLVVLGWASCVAGDFQRVAYWKQPRAAVIRDTIYLDGGEIMTCLWNTSASTCDTGATPQSTNLGTKGNVYKLNFNQTFSVHDEFTTIFGIWTSGPEPANPPFRSGFMFADDYEFYTFGGISAVSMGEQAKLLNDIIWKPNGQIPSTIGNYQAGLDNTYTIPSKYNVSRYVTHGAGINIPDEYMSFYFSGLRTASSGYIEDSNPSTNPTVIVDQMVQVDLRMVGSAQWSIVPLGMNVQGRAGAQLAWIPFGLQGLLVVIGGKLSLGDALASSSDYNPSDDSQFMNDLSIYDIHGNSWYQQSTLGDSPPQTAEFCTVVAHQSGTESYQIFAYGGYNGDLTSNPYNTVWILSIPSFQWTNVTPVNSDAGRYGHFCTIPYHDQMLVVGGTGTEASYPLPHGEIVQVLDLSIPAWKDTYEPSHSKEYTIPSKVKNQSGLDQPAAGMAEGLYALFQHQYPGQPTIWYPPQSTSSSKKRWLVPVLAGVLGGVAVAILGVLIWLFYRRKSRKSRQGSSAAPTSETQVTEPRDGVENWRNLVVKSVASSGIREFDSSDRSTVNNDPVEVAGVGAGRTYLHSPRSPRSSHLPAGVPSPGSPQSGSFEISGDPSSRQELHGSLNSVPSMAQQPDYHFHKHPLFPLNVNDTMSVSESALTSGPGQVSSVDTEHPNTTMMSYRAGPLGAGDPFNQVLYGRVPPVPPKQPVVGTSEVANLRHQPSTGRIPYEDIYPGDPLPSPITKELPATRPTVRGGLRTFQIMPSEMGLQSPLTHGPAPTNTPTNQVPPGMHQRTVSDESAVTIELPPSPDQLPPSPSPAENHRRSKILDSMPERPAQASESTATWPQQTSSPWQAGSATHLRVVPPTNTAATRRKEVGSPVRSAYEENSSRFQGH